MIDTLRENLPPPDGAMVDRDEMVRESERARCIAEIVANYERGAFDYILRSNFNRGMRYAVAVLRGLA